MQYNCDRLKALMQRAILILSVAVPGAILVLMVRIILRDWRDIETLTVSPSPRLLLVSLILGLANLATLCFIWRSLLSRLDAGARTIPPLTLMKVFMQSWFARYLPGKIWTLAGRVYLGTRHGIPAEVLSVSAFLEFSLSIAAQGALALAAALLLFRGMLGLSLMTLAFFSACLLGAIALLHPALTGRLLNTGFRRLGMASLNLHGVVTLSMLLRFFGAYGIATLLLTGSFVSLVASVMENASLDGVTTGGAFIIAHFVGRLVFILPAGLGIREGLLSLFLGTTLPLSAAAFAAVASRGWFVLIDLVAALALTVLATRGFGSSKYWAKMAQASLRDPQKLRLHARYLYRSRLAKVFLVSYPKTGRTWIRLMVGRAIVRAYAVPESVMLDTYELTKRAGLPRATFTHDGPFGLSSGASYRALAFRVHLYTGRKVALLTRDIRDTLVSSYFHETRRTGMFRDSMSAFVRDDVFGAKKFVTFYTLWYRHRHVPRELLLIRYEDLHRNPAGELARVLAFMEAPVTGVIREDAVAYGSFGNMRRLEQENALNDSILAQNIAGDEESRKVRRGKVAGFTEYLSAEDLAYIAEVVRELGDGSCDWYYAPEVAAKSGADGR
jgi:hypothetical protein